jgi:hypothetical protein
MFWDSTVGFPGLAWDTTAQIRQLPITVPFTTFRAHFVSTPQQLIVANVPSDVDVEDQTLTIGSDPPIVAVGTHIVMSGTSTQLYAGYLAEGERNFRFLGWYRGVAPPPIGTPIAELTGVVETPSHSFTMPASTTRYFALWGDRYIGIPGDPPFTVTFHLYTDRAELKDEFGYEAEMGDYEVLAIEVPVTPGEDRGDWADQDLLDIVSEIGNIYGVSGTPGHAFWGWFDGDTLTDSTRTRADSRRPGEFLRRPGLGDTCSFEEILTLIENATTDALVEALFGDPEEGNIDVFAIWSLWGDVNDDDEVNVLDLELFRRYLMYNHFPWEDIRLNIRAADVIVDNDVNVVDLEHLRRYLMYNHFPWEDIVLGIRP